MALLPDLLQKSIHLWVLKTGRRFAAGEIDWLLGPMGGKGRIGKDYYKKIAEEGDFEIRNDPSQGLTANLGLLNNRDFNIHRLQPAIVDFYEHTSDYRMEIWAKWVGPVKPFAQVLIRMLSRRIEQFNLPLDVLESAQGMSSQVIALHRDGQQKYACWLRQSADQSKVIYAGFYTIAHVPRLDKPCVKTVFPLPNGCVSVLLRPEAQADGSLKLVSDGKKIGDAGYYRIQKAPDGTLRVKYVPIKETIHVYTDAAGTLRTNHSFRFGPFPFLHLHYKIEKLAGR